MKKQYIIGFSIVACALVYLAWTIFSTQYRFMMTPTEFATSMQINAGKEIKITGIVKNVTGEAFGRDLKFQITDEQNSIDVHFDGKVPNNFGDGAEVITTGVFDPKSGVFEATEMLTKCASKYRAE